MDDDRLTREFLVTALQEEGCRVDVAADGELGLKLLLHQHYDVVLLDILLPKMTGTEIMERLLEKRPEALSTIVVVTGIEVSEIRKVFPEVCDVLSKPLLPSRVSRVVRHCIGRRHSRGVA